MLNTFTDILRIYASSGSTASKENARLEKESYEDFKEELTVVALGRKSFGADLEKSNAVFKFILDMDAALVPVYRTQDGYRIVTADIVSKFGVSCAQLIDDALETFKRKEPATARSMASVLAGFVSDELDLVGPPMYVVTTGDNIFGASAVFQPGYLDTLHSKLGDFMLLPSSVHEVIVVKITDHDDLLGFDDMVRGINAAEVAPDERLSDRAFCYDGEKLRPVTEYLKATAV